MEASPQPSPSPQHPSASNALVTAALAAATSSIAPAAPRGWILNEEMRTPRPMRNLVPSTAADHEIEAARAGHVAGCCGPADVKSDS